MTAEEVIKGIVEGWPGGEHATVIKEDGGERGHRKRYKDGHGCPLCHAADYMAQVEKDKRRPPYACPKCGSSEGVQALDWIDINSGEVLGGNDDPGPGGYWCGKCDDSFRRPLIMSEGTERNEARNARRRWLRKQFKEAR